MRLVEKRYNLEFKNTRSGEGNWLVPFVSDDFKACERKARWYLKKTSEGMYLGYLKDDILAARIWDKKSDTYTKVF